MIYSESIANLFLCCEIPKKSCQDSHNASSAGESTGVSQYRPEKLFLRRTKRETLPAG